MQEGKYDDRMQILSWGTKEENQGKRRMKVRNWLSQWMAGSGEVKRLNQGVKVNK